MLISNDKNEVSLTLSLTLITDEEALEEQWAGEWEDRLNAYLSWAQWLRHEGVPFLVDLPDWEEYPDVASPITAERLVVLEWATTHIRHLHKVP